MAEEMTILTQSLIVASSSTFHQIGDLERWTWKIDEGKLCFCGFCSNRILPYFPLLVCVCTGVTSHISHIYKGINAMLIIRGPIKPYIF